MHFMPPLILYGLEKQSPILLSSRRFSGLSQHKQIASPVFVTWKIRLPNADYHDQEDDPEKIVKAHSKDIKKDCIAKDKKVRRKKEEISDEEKSELSNELVSTPHEATGIEKLEQNNYTETLRGCIGTFSKEDVKKALPLYALISAFDDSRFPPISLHEMPYLTCTVSFLRNFTKITNPNDWEIGKHGLQIRFEDKGTKYDATFLPEVPKEEGWTKRKTITELIRKSGYEGKLQKVRRKLVIERYDSEAATATFTDYLDFVTKNKGYFGKPEKLQLLSGLSVDSDSDEDMEDGEEKEMDHSDKGKEEEMQKR
eukprot:TRINITY_DN135021_c2_g1_i1.p3 TRINITY_DN135021_c2_g1~~TRINITY_DN135021_c2_g1_i1.p3  ORF type:complete len:312 (-),score=47.61 TRINITY_DN135021_c2_g1_i1:114-1049(-)